MFRRRVHLKVKQLCSEAYIVFLKRPLHPTDPHPSDDAVKIASLIQYAIDSQARYKQLGSSDDLNEAITFAQKALSLCPPGHPDRSIALNNLAIYLSSRYKLQGRIDDLNEAIAFGEKALSLRPPGHPDRSISLNNLAVDLSHRYNLLGEIDDLSKAIVLAQDALSLRQPGHPDRSTSLNNLANRLSSRYKLLGGVVDLNKAIFLDRDALLLRPAGHPHRSTSLYNLAIDLSSRYKLLGGIDDLNEAIVFGREALSLRPSGHPFRSSSLNNLANNLSSRYELLGGIDDLNEAIVFAQEALSLCPRGHPDRSISLHNLAIELFSRYQKSGGINDLDEAITLAQEALSLCPSGHPDHSVTLNNLASYFLSRHDLLEGISDSHAAVKDKQEVFNLYTELKLVSQIASLDDLSAARAWVSAAEKFSHSTTLPAYETALRLLIQHLATLSSLPQHLGGLKSLSSFLAVDGFSACLRNQSPTKAVELLEQGFSILWGQLNRLRSPLDDAATSGPEGKMLVKEYTRLTLLARNILNSTGSKKHDQVCHLNVELQKVASKIRGFPGLSRFLLPSLFSDLQRAARDGPVIIMNASQYGCDALVVFSDKDPIHIPLPVSKADVRGLSVRLRALTRGSKSMDLKDVEEKLMIFLRELWDRVVSHIVDVLQLACSPRPSRIWWCPTAEFSLLPLHAATPYRKGQKGVSDLYVSSYTTTLTSLIHARRPSLPDSTRKKKRIIGIGQAAAKVASKLPSVGTELDNIGQVVKDLATFRRIEGENSRVSAVADELSKNEWAHFTCHGIPNQERPFESAFALHDGRLTVQHIIQRNLQDPEFAYLSACHTNVGDQESSEMIHLASVMQLAGFRSVVGTMGEVDGSQTDKVTSMFYKLMIDESGCLDYTRAARALWTTMREVDIPMDQRILYMHFGA